VATVPTGSMPFGLQTDGTGSLLYVANPASDDVSVIDLSVNTVTATIAIGIPGATPTGFGNFMQASSPVLTGAVSRKTHGAQGSFALPIDIGQPIGGLITTEPRAIGDGHVIVLTFDRPVGLFTGVTAVDAHAMSAGTASAAVVGGQIEVRLTDVPDNRRVTIAVTGVNGIGAASVSMGFLVGNVSRGRTLNAADIAAIKANAGPTIVTGNFKFDLNTDGVIDYRDVAAAKARAAWTMP
jgi:YVTN family beta-propeller protein